MFPWLAGVHPRPVACPACQAASLGEADEASALPLRHRPPASALHVKSIRHEHPRPTLARASTPPGHTNALPSIVEVTGPVRVVGQQELTAGESDGGEAEAPTDPSELKLGDLEALRGVVKFPVRIKCATLSWNTLTQGLEDAAAGA